MGARLSRSVAASGSLSPTRCARSANVRRQRHERIAAVSATTIRSNETFDDLRDVLHQEVSRLPEKYRAAVVLCLMEGMSPEQAAQQLAWPVGTVHSRLARGRARLRHRLRHRGLAPDTDNTQSELAAEPAVIPAALVAATRQAATRLAAGELLAAIVSDSVVSLAIEGLRTQMVTKLVITGAQRSLLASQWPPRACWAMSLRRRTAPHGKRPR